MISESVENESVVVIVDTLVVDSTVVDMIELGIEDLVQVALLLLWL